jgi:hypothetical protein
MVIDAGGQALRQAHPNLELGIMQDLDQEYMFKAMLAQIELPTNPYVINVDEQHISCQSSP